MSASAKMLASALTFAIRDVRAAALYNVDRLGFWVHGAFGQPTTSGTRNGR